MDPKEILGYVTEGMKWLAIGGTSTYVGIMLSNPISMLFSKKIRNQGELDSIIEDESTKLGLHGVKGIFSDENIGCAYLDTQGTPTIEVGGIGANASNVRHELYHIFRGDCNPTQANSFISGIKYLVIKEPRASLYQSTGIKL